VSLIPLEASSISYKPLEAVPRTVEFHFETLTFHLPLHLRPCLIPIAMHYCNLLDLYTLRISADNSDI
jgi:hypothetical protein